MEHKRILIDSILKDFLKSEADSTDMRIMSIRNFLSTLNNAIDKYLENSGNSDMDSKKRLIIMLDDMAEIYRNEISSLLVKRGKLQHYIDVFNMEDMKHKEKIVGDIRRNIDNSNDLINYIN